MNPIIVAFLVSCALSLTTGAQSPVIAFKEGKTSKFSTRDHPKAKGAVFTIKYPDDWIAKEGERPNVVQKFISESGKGFEYIMIMTKAIPVELTFGEDDLKEMFSKENLKSFLPEDAKFFRAISTRIEDVPAGIIEFSAHTVNAGLEKDSYGIVLVFVQGHTLVTIQGEVASIPAKAAELPARFAAFRPLFQLVMNTVVFVDKWK